MKLDEAADAYLASLAETLRRRREAAGMSKNRLAERAGLSQQMVSYVEKRMKSPTAGTLYRMARALGTTPARILTEAEGETDAKSGSPLKYPAPEDFGARLVAEAPPRRIKGK